MKDQLDSTTPDLFRRLQRTHANSLKAYREERTRFLTREQAILEWLKANGPSTDREVKLGLHFEDMNSVRPRITEMIERGVLHEHAVRVHDPATGKSVRVVAVK